MNPRTLGAKFLRLIAPADENQRMELRRAIACSEAHAEDLQRTLVNIPAQDIASMIERVKSSRSM